MWCVRGRTHTTLTHGHCECAWGLVLCFLVLLVVDRGPWRGTAKLVKHAVVRVPRSVYAATPGRNKYRPSQASPISNLVMAGDWTSQKFLGSMEGAVLAGKLAAELVSDRALGGQGQPLKPVQEAIITRAAAATPKQPVGVRGDFPIAFGGGSQGVGSEASHP